MIRVVDTNVPLVLKFEDEHPPELVEACQDIIMEILENRIPVPVDAGGEIVAEYFHQMTRGGQADLADLFARYVHDACWSWDEELRPDLGADPEIEHRYDALAGDDAEIDPSDRKFVAVAKLTGVPIVQATDTKWLNWTEVLARHGVEVHFVHEGAIREAYRRKFGQEAP